MLGFGKAGERHVEGVVDVQRDLPVSQGQRRHRLVGGDPQLHDHRAIEVRSGTDGVRKTGFVATLALAMVGAARGYNVVATSKGEDAFTTKAESRCALWK